MPAEAHFNLISRFVFLLNYVFLGNHADPDEMPYSGSTFSFFLWRLWAGGGLDTLYNLIICICHCMILYWLFACWPMAFCRIFLHDYYRTLKECVTKI